MAIGMDKTKERKSESLYRGGLLGVIALSLSMPEPVPIRAFFVR